MAEVETQKDLDFERKHEEDLRRIRDFRLMDDNFMSKVFEDKPCASYASPFRVRLASSRLLLYLALFATAPLSLR